MNKSLKKYIYLLLLFLGALILINDFIYASILSFIFKPYSLGLFCLFIMVMQIAFFRNQRQKYLKTTMTVALVVIVVSYFSTNISDYIYMRNKISVENSTNTNHLSKQRIWVFYGLIPEEIQPNQKGDIQVCSPGGTVMSYNPEMKEWRIKYDGF